MNVKLHNVISQIHGKSGMRVLKAIVKGESNPEALSALCEDSILKKKRTEVIASLKGNFRQEHIFALEQAIAAYEFYQDQLAQCDKQIEELLEQFTEERPIPPDIKKPKPIRHNVPKVDELHTKLMIITQGKDPTSITGMNDKTLLEIISETGLNLEANWKTKKHFTSWLALCPTMHKSGKSNKKRKVKNILPPDKFLLRQRCLLPIVNTQPLQVFINVFKQRKGGGLLLRQLPVKLQSVIMI